MQVFSEGEKWLMRGYIFIVRKLCDFYSLRDVVDAYIWKARHGQTNIW